MLFFRILKVCSFSHQHSYFIALFCAVNKRRCDCVLHSGAGSAHPFCRGWKRWVKGCRGRDGDGWAFLLLKSLKFLVLFNQFYVERKVFYLLVILTLKECFLGPGSRQTPMGSKCPVCPSHQPWADVFSLFLFYWWGSLKFREIKELPKIIEFIANVLLPLHSIEKSYLKWIGYRCKFAKMEVIYLIIPSLKCWGF